MKTKTTPLALLKAITMCALLFAGGIKAQTVSIGDSLALVEFYNKTNGASWNSHENWLTGNVVSWQGITVVNGRVTSLALPLNNVTGALPYHLGFLQELKSLELPGNGLTGNIPSAIVFLQKLEVLNLSENQFSGNIPAASFLLTKVSNLNLSKNKLTGPIPSCSLLVKLRRLDLSDNLLTGNIPTQLGSLTNLEGLFLSNNKLTGAIPSTLGKLKKLTELYLDNNELSQGIPSSLKDAKELVFFSAANNKLSGAVPSAISTLPKLYFFNISGNAIKDLPNLSGMASLFQLIVADNKLTFFDIQPNLSKMLPGSYIPQDSVGTNQAITVCAGQSIVLSGDVIESSPANRFVWFTTDGSFVSEESSSPILTIPSAASANAGRYSVAISNANVPDLYLFRKTIRVDVETCGGSAKGAVSVFPVPFDHTTIVNVTSEKTSPLAVVVKNSNGKILEQHTGSTNESITVGSTLGKGIFFVETFYENTREVTRVMKN